MIVRNQKDLVVTERDMQYIVDHRIVEDIYTMYKGMAINDDSYGEKKERLRLEYIFIMKAFFTPIYVLTAMPTDLATRNIQRDSLMSRSNEIKDIGARTNLKKALTTTVSEIKRFAGMEYDDFKRALPFMQYGRRFSVLTQYFNIDQEILYKSLYAVVVANTTPLPDEPATEPARASTEQS